MWGYPASLQYGFRKASTPYSVASAEFPEHRFGDQGFASGYRFSDTATAPKIRRPFRGWAPKLVSRRHREEIPGSFGRHGCAVCDVVGAGPNAGSDSSSHYRSSPARPRDGSDSNSN